MTEEELHTARKPVGFNLLRVSARPSTSRALTNPAGWLAVMEVSREETAFIGALDACDSYLEFADRLSTALQQGCFSLVQAKYSMGSEKVRKNNLTLMQCCSAFLDQLCYATKYLLLKLLNQTCHCRLALRNTIIQWRRLAV